MPTLKSFVRDVPAGVINQMTMLMSASVELIICEAVKEAGLHACLMDLGPDGSSTLAYICCQPQAR